VSPSTKILQTSVHTLSDDSCTCAQFFPFANNVLFSVPGKVARYFEQTRCAYTTPNANMAGYVTLCKPHLEAGKAVCNFPVLRKKEILSPNSAIASSSFRLFLFRSGFDECPTNSRSVEGVIDLLLVFRHFRCDIFLAD